MLTDIFAARYVDRPIWTAINEPERVLLIQGWRIVAEQLMPYRSKDGKVDNQQKLRWESVESRLSMELGLESLSPATYGYYDINKNWQGGTYSTEMVCRSWMLEPYKGGDVTPDRYMKERISFVELAFRDRMGAVAAQNALHKPKPKPNTLPMPVKTATQEGVLAAIAQTQELVSSFVMSANAHVNAVFVASCDEINERFHRAKAPLNYHNGFIQIQTDEVVEQQIAKPFWKLVGESKWKNVEIDMMEAVDRRETAQRDPAFYAAKALESAIKIISNEKKWTRGTEKTVNHYIDNLQSKGNGGFVQGWEADAIRHIFTNVRNELGHGPGGEPMPKLTQQQTDWTIEAAMSWTKSLIRRL